MIYLVWPPERRAQIIALAASGMTAMDIAAEMKRSLKSIISYCGRNSISIIKYSPEVQAEFDRRAVLREKSRSAQRVAKNKERRIAARQAIIAVAAKTGTPAPAAKPKLTVHEIRAKFPMPANPTKNELRAMLRDAVQNTVAMQSTEASA